MKRILPLLVLVAALAGWYALRRHRVSAAAPTKSAAAPAASTPSSPPVELPPNAAPARAKVTAQKPPQASRGQTVIQAAWGSQPGQFGRRRDPESNPEAPMAMVAGRGGELDIVDQVNRRVQRFRGGKLTGTIQTGGDTVQDLAPLGDGRTALLDRLADQNLQIYDADGKLINEVPLVGQGVKEGGDVTGVFSDDDGIYVEREHGSLVKIAGPDGSADASRPELVGRPTRDGRLLVQAAITGRGAGEVTVSAWDRKSGQPLWSQPVALGAPVLHVVMLDSDPSGMIYLAGDVGDEGTAPPYPILNERIVVVRLSGGGDLRGAIEIPPFPTADESFRPMSVGDDGAVYVMVPGESGLEVLRYVFP